MATFQIKTIFTKGTLKERAYHCNAYEMKYDFAPVLKQQMVSLTLIMIIILYSVKEKQGV